MVETDSVVKSSTSGGKVMEGLLPPYRKVAYAPFDEDVEEDRLKDHRRCLRHTA